MRIRTTKDLGAAIKQARFARGLTQRELAAILAIDQSRISTIERGSPGISVGTILRVLAALRATASIALEPDAPSQPRSKKTNDSVDLDAIANTGLSQWPIKR